MSCSFIIAFPDLMNPFSGNDLNKASAMVLLPDPDSPTIPIDCPLSISNEILSTAVRFPNLDLYIAVRFSIIIFPLLLLVYFPFPDFLYIV